MICLSLFLQIIGICQAGEVKLVSVTPSSNTILTYEPIQIVFSEAIIKFGTDLSSPTTQSQGYPIILESSGDTSPLDFGSWRWITTSILRFDANDERWPGDLAITAIMNTTFTSYKGGIITFGRDSPPSWKTQSLNFYISSVFSPLATTATEGAWQSNLGYLGYFNKYEIPPDSIITVWTDAPVDTTLVSRPGFIYCDGISVRYSKPPQTIPHHPCAIPGRHTNHTTCFNITLSTPLGPTEECKLTLSRTMPYDRHSGPWNGGQVSIVLSGIIPFNFVFYTPSQRGDMSSKRLSLAIQHGLRTGTNLTSIINTTPSVPGYTAMVRNSSRVVLSGHFKPGTEYSVKVVPRSYSFVDNLGMPLEGSYGHIFRMADERDDMYYPNNAYDVTQFPLKDSTQGYPMLTRNSTRWNVTACSVTPINLGEVLHTVFGLSRWGSTTTICRRKDDISIHTIQLKRGVTHLLNSTEINGLSNISVVSITDNSRQYPWYHRPRIIIRSDIQVLVSPVYMSAGAMVNNGVYSNISGIHIQLTSPLVAIIQLWGQEYARPLYVGNTNTMGYLFIPQCSSSSTSTSTCLQSDVIVVVLIDDEVVYIHPSRIYFNNMYGSGHDVVSDLEQRLYMTLVSDRAIYAPGEVITISGWIVSSSSTCLACQPRNIRQYVFNATLTWSSSSSLPKGEVAILVDDQGMVHPFNITVPKSAPLGSRPSVDITCRQHYIHTGTNSSVFQSECMLLGMDITDILIAEPRVPIAIMEFTPPSVITTHDTLTSDDLYITLATYSGTPLPNTTVQVTVKVIQPPYRDSVGPCDIGQQEGYTTYSVTYDTDENGEARLTLFDDTLTGPWQEGYIIEITAVSRDPLGAVLSCSGSISIKHPILSLDGLELSVTNPIPGIIFQAITYVTFTNNTRSSSSLDELSARAYATPSTTCRDATLSTDANKDDLIQISKSNCSVSVANALVECTMVLDDDNIANDYAIVVEVERDNTIDDDGPSSSSPVKVCKVIQSTPKVTTYAFNMESVKCTASLNNGLAATVGYSANEVQLSCANPYPNAEEDTFVWVTWPGGHSGLLTLDKGYYLNNTFTRIITVYNLTSLGNSITFSAYFWQTINTQLPFSLSLSDDRESGIIPHWGGSRYASGSAVLDISSQLALPYNKYRDTFSVHTDKDEEYLPGEEVTLSINGGVPNGRVILTVVDKGVLDLKPLNTPNTIQNVIGMMGTVTCSMMDSHSFISSSKTLSSNAYHLWSIAEDDPWINVDFDPYWIDNDYLPYLNTSIFEQQLGPGNYKADDNPVAAVAPRYNGRCGYREKDGIDDEVYYTSPLESGSVNNPLLDMPAPSDRSPGGAQDNNSPTNGQDATSAPPREATDTPKMVYYTTINLTSNGNATASFILPQHRQRYIINAYMIGYNDNDNITQLASTQSTITVSSPIYMEPYIPRALRITDEPFMGVAVIAPNYTVDELISMNLSVLIHNVSEEVFSPIDEDDDMSRKDVIIIPGNAGVPYALFKMPSMAILAFKEYKQYAATARQLWLKPAVDAIKDIINTYPHAKPYEDVARLYHATGATRLDGLPHPYDDIKSFTAMLEGPMDHSLTAWLLVKVSTSDISIQDAQTLLWNNIRISSSDTAYIAYPASASPLSDNLQALALHLAAISVKAQGEDIELLWRIGVWVGQGGIEGKWGIYNKGLSTETLIHAIQAFNAVDNSLTNDNAGLSLNVTVSEDGYIIWNTQLNKNITSSYLSYTNLPHLPFNTTLKWNVTGTGTALSFLTANILPRHPFQWPIDRGFMVKKFIQDMTPSGLEPLDDNIDSLNLDTAATGIEYSKRSSSSSSSTLMPCNSHWWLPCQRVTKRTGKDSVVWEVDGITASQEMTFKYLATANVPGDYALPQTKCYDITNPTYMGMSGHSRYEFTVTLPGVLSGLVLPLITEDMARRALLGDEGTDCVGKAPLENSWCDLSSGKWMCGMSSCDDIQAAVLQGECDEANKADGTVAYILERLPDPDSRADLRLLNVGGEDLDIASSSSSF
ncbi:hypothetical protein FOL47_005957 [Perkinsus chesapeaki]|uniref:Protein arginine methyltransferase 10 n=1 Tax=Perkinsus chesapeaki TaxID=330153 RepID=A0A7J6N080_PERCH|nr:hypothetical protein FOL47_005957 [Perkinsus chesapeaki]